MANESSLVAHTNTFWWTIPLELLQLTFSGIGLISSTVFISIVITQHQLRQNLALLLAANLSIGGLLFCASFIAQVFYMLTNSEPDRLCSFRGYLYVTGIAYTFQATILQTVHRLFVTVFVHLRQLQNRWLFLFLALAQVFISFVALLPLLIGGHFPYLPDGKVCYIAFNDLFGIFYPSSLFYFAPLIIQCLLSCWILRHISRETQAGRAKINIERRVRKERRILIRLSLPYALHLSLMGISAAIGAGMSVNAIINKQVWKIICSSLRCLRKNHRQNTVHVIVQQNLTVHQTSRIRVRTVF
jgi:hypothetical protein